MWQFNLNRVIRYLVPVYLRRPRFLAWLNASIGYLALILEGLRQNRYETTNEAYMTPQIIYLEHLLNDRYGRTDIFISDGYLLGPWIFADADTPNPEFYMNDDPEDSYVYSQSDQVTVNFIVNIPSVLSTVTQDIAAMVQKFKLAGKYFIIQIFQV